MNNYIWLLSIFTLAGFLINRLGRNVFPKSVISIVGCLVVLVSFGLSIAAFSQVSSGGRIEANLFNWFNAGTLNVSFSFLVDRLSILMMLIISGFGFLILLYSVGYMNHDEGFGKFFSYLNLFIFFMLLLVMGSNSLVMFIGWEGVGLCSYLLIGFWYTNSDYAEAAKKAFVMNRIGD